MNNLIRKVKRLNNLQIENILWSILALVMFIGLVCSLIKLYGV